MARVTVEDCLAHVKNRFELVMLASKRARQLMRGSVEPTVSWENDKPTVVALREIANGHIDFSDAHQADIIPKSTPIEDIEVLFAMDQAVHLAEETTTPVELALGGDEQITQTESCESIDTTNPDTQAPETSATDNANESE